MNLNSLSNLIELYFKLGLCCIVYSNVYPILNRLLLYNNNYLLLPQHKKNYIIKNVWKTIMMIYLCFYTWDELLNIIFLKYLDMNFVRIAGILYVANDLTGLIMVDKLPINTIMHHITTFILLNVVFIFDGNELEIIRLILIYTIFSYFSFLVNLYLGCRFLVLDITENNKISIKMNKCIDLLKDLAFYNYSIALFCNFLVHLYYGLYCITTIGFQHIIYLVFLIPIIKDDMILLSWLKK
mgnify:CR=1 FL=1|tara:strand:- start:3449 stop:4168 length:720 start_codon:yes stop_codon:yes gene_type:complete